MTEKGVAPELDLDRLLAHARALVGVELGELADRLGLAVPSSVAGSARWKGWAGQIVERELGVEGGARGPDFVHLSLELKTVPVDAHLHPRESTAVCQIDPIAIAAESWRTSAVREKLARVLFVAIARPAGSLGRAPGARRVSAVRLWTPSHDEDDLLRSDFELFVRGYFRRGRATAITGHLGVALQVRPKGRNAADLRDGYDEAGRPVRVPKTGFYLRPWFVDRLLRGAA